MDTFNKAKAKLTGKHAPDPAPEGEPAPSRLLPPNPAFLSSGGSDDGYSSSSDGNPVSPVTPPPMHASHFGAPPLIEGEGKVAKSGGILQNARRSLSGGEARGKVTEIGPSFERQPSQNGSVRSPTFSAVPEDAVSSTSEEDDLRPRRPTFSDTASPPPSAPTTVASPTADKLQRPGPSPREPSCLKFAPLPKPGPRSKRNSINLGVAARANLLQGQGDPMEGLVSVPDGAVRECQGHCEEEVWYGESPVEPPTEAYTINDATRQVRKLFRRISSSGGSAGNRSSSSGTSSPDRPVLPHQTVSDPDSPGPSRVRAQTADPTLEGQDSVVAGHEDEDVLGQAQGQGFRGRTRHVGIGTREVRDTSTTDTAPASAVVAPLNNPEKAAHAQDEDDVAHDGEDEAEDEDDEEEEDGEEGEGVGGDTDTLDGDEAERARQRSTTRAGGIEKVHKHRD